MLVSFTIEMSNIIIYIIVVHLRKLFKFQIYSRAPGWIELAPGYTSVYILHMVLSGALAPNNTFTILLIVNSIMGLI